MENNLFPITTLEGVQVVDSRLIADALGIQHQNFMATLKEYQQKVESFGSLTFETEVRKRQVGATTAKFVYLNEEQALFMGTLSKNTPEVVEFKRMLVASFSQARHGVSDISRMVQSEILKQTAHILPDLEMLFNNEMIAYHLRKVNELHEANRKRLK